MNFVMGELEERVLIIKVKFKFLRIAAFLFTESMVKILSANVMKIHS